MAAAMSLPPGVGFLDPRTIASRPVRLLLASLAAVGGSGAGDGGAADGAAPVLVRLVEVGANGCERSSWWVDSASADLGHRQLGGYADQRGAVAPAWVLLVA